MRSISDTIARLGDAAMAGVTGMAAGVQGDASALVEMTGFGTDPGNLRALVHLPDGPSRGRPLVVVLHGCTQSAAAYDRGSGWSDLADRHGFAVLFVEQRRANNANLCFNWFVPDDVAASGGEAESIRQMVETAVSRHSLDATRIYVTGLSAGGAMTSVMLATCPDLFAGGAIIAGLPFGMASGVSQAFDRMRGHGYDVATLRAALRGAIGTGATLPIVSVWQGSADTTVAPANAATIVDQWRGVHDVAAAPVIETIDRHEHRMWRDARGRTVIEEYRVAGMGHGTPLATRGDEALGTPGAHMLDAGISSTYRIAAFWSLVPAVAERAPGSVQSSDARSSGYGSSSATPQGALSAFDPGRIINDALRQAGLLK